ncbi:MAG: mechanosensitive ion channel [Thioploca sp.]|nr:mechanosensitive ion channel [Thioploca sp.]
MATPTNSVNSEILFKKLLIPLVLSLILGVFILYGGEAYQSSGLAALKNIVTISGYVLGIAEFWVLAVLVQRIVQYVLLEKFIAAALDTQVPRLLIQLSSAIIYLLAIAAIVGVIFKQDLTFIIAASGAVSVVVGLSLKNLILDLFAGLAMNLDQTIKIGDCIRLHDGGRSIEGEVQEISWRTTRILDSNGNIVVIPNSRVSSCTITNFSVPQPFFEDVVTVVLGIEVPVERAKRILQSAAIETSPHFSVSNAPKPSVSIKNITLQGVEYAVVIYPTFKTRFRGHHLVQQQILQHLHCAGLSSAIQKPVTVSAQWDFVKPTINHLVMLLGTTELFQDLAEPELQLLATSASLRQLPTQVQVIQGGEIATAMFLVIEGILSAKNWRKKVGKNLSDEPKVLLSPGYLIGGNAMLAGDTYNFTIYTESEVLLCEIDQTVIEKLLTQQPESGRWLSRRVAIQLSQQIANGESSRYQSISSDNKIEDLAQEVFKNLQRSFAHLKLT